MRASAKSECDITSAARLGRRAAALKTLPISKWSSRASGPREGRAERSGLAHILEQHVWDGVGDGISSAGLRDELAVDDVCVEDAGVQQLQELQVLRRVLRRALRQALEAHLRRRRCVNPARCQRAGRCALGAAGQGERRGRRTSAAASSSTDHSSFGSIFTMTSCRNSVSKRSTCAGTILSGYVPLSGHCSRLCVSSFMVGGRAAPPSTKRSTVPL